MKTKVIDSGIPYNQIQEYFEKEATALSSKKYRGEGWEVELESLPPGGYKNLPIPRTRLMFTGDDRGVEEGVRRYRRAFLRGGG